MEGRRSGRARWRALFFPSPTPPAAPAPGERGAPAGAAPAPRPAVQRRRRRRGGGPGLSRVRSLSPQSAAPAAPAFGSRRAHRRARSSAAASRAPPGARPAMAGAEPTRDDLAAAGRRRVGVARRRGGDGDRLPRRGRRFGRRITSDEPSHPSYPPSPIPSSKRSGDLKPPKLRQAAREEGGWREDASRRLHPLCRSRRPPLTGRWHPRRWRTRLEEGAGR